ncbi:MAG: methyltransferase [Deltaproteobacteria bacterium]|nr:methyltransferase [Deltaproteobacteria bacterium]
MAEVAKDLRITRDALFGGRVALAQPARSTAKYRVNVDAIHLASFAHLPSRCARAAVDLGAGVGAVALSLVHLGAAARVTLIENDAALAALARMNAEANAWADRLEVVLGDVADRTLVAAGSADLVVCNPPYVAPGRGRPALSPRAAARSGALETFLDAARRLAGRRARVCFVYPAVEATTLLVSLRQRGLEPKRLRLVHAKAAAPARIVLVEALPAKPGGLVVEPPLVEG